MPKTTATTTAPPTDTNTQVLAPDTAASDTVGSDSAEHAPDRREAPTPAADGPAGDAPARVTRAGDLEDRVWAALRRHPGATAAELATEASASRSAVGKLLAAWAADGSATSTPGFTPRTARRWTAAPTHDATTTEPPTEPATTADTAEPEHGADDTAARTPDPVTRPDAINAETADTTSQAHPDSGSRREAADADEDDSLRDDASTTAADAAAGETSTAEEPHRGADREDEAAPDGAKAGDPRPAEEGHSEARDDETDDAEVDEADDAEGDAEADTEVDHADREGTATTGSEGGAPTHRPERATGHGPGRPPTSSRTSPRTTRTRNRSGSTRLAKGALRGQVEDYLAETPGEHSPVEIGKVLGRSSGAIANALEALVESGDAVRTRLRPRRYSHPDHADDVARTGSDRDGASDGTVPAPGRTRTRGPGRGVTGVGTYVTVLAVLPLDSIGAISTDEIADWVRAQLPEPVLFASAAHGVTRAALSAGADPSHWPNTTTDGVPTEGVTTEGVTADGATTEGATTDDTTTEGGTADDIAADPAAGGEEQPQARVESGVGA